MERQLTTTLLEFIAEAINCLDNKTAALTSTDSIPSNPTLYERP
jgi:hypothetical protein